MAEYERAGQILPENVINSKISKSLVFDLPCKSTEGATHLNREKIE